MKSAYSCLILGAVLSTLSAAPDCTELIAEADTTLSFTSHPEYGITVYPSNYDVCWEITAPVGYVLEMWTSSANIEAHVYCNHDYLKIWCGANGNDGKIGKYCNWGRGIPEYRAVYTKGRGARVRFITDSDTGNNGFRFNYRALLAENVHGDDCQSTKKKSKDEIDLTGSEIAMIVIFVVVMPAVVLVPIGIVVYAHSQKGRRRSGVVPHVVEGNNMPTSTLPPPPTYATATARTNPPIFTAPPASSLPPLVVQNKPLISNDASNAVDSLEMQSTFPGGSETQNAPRIQPPNRLPPINGSNDGEGVPDAPWYEPPK